ncbi:hypothetical protein SDC9_145542 [bioreactor metagenome]|uniref:Uncharacterized protein n=1 Tax=bioreactor metagenome TaxID=1076179 RepID=A0A645E9R5_9ZZZZ
MGGAGGDDFDEGHALLLYALDDELLQADGIIGGRPRHKGCAGGFCELADVKGLLDVAVPAGCRGGTLRGRAGVLAARHAVVVVVDHDGRHVDVAAAGMDEVVAADGGTVAVPH